MNNKEVIIDIIVQDMLLNQYISALRKLGIEVYDVDLDLMVIVRKLMQIKDEEITDTWSNLYLDELTKSESVSIKPFGKNLYQHAEQCYNSLLNHRTKILSERDNCAY